MIRMPEDCSTEESIQCAIRGRITEKRNLIPEPVSHRAVAGHIDEASRSISNILVDGYQPSGQRVLAASKSRLGIRPAPQWGLTDEVAYRALGDRLEQELGPPTNMGSFSEFKNAPLEANPEYVLTADIHACYQYIDHGLLIDEVAARTGRRTYIESMTSMVEQVSGRRYGLPQSSHASDVVADAYLGAIERGLKVRDFQVWRYNDDFRFALDSWSEVVEAMELLEGEARRVGLTLNDSKTVPYKVGTYKDRLNEADNEFQRIVIAATLDLTDFGDEYEPGYEPSDTEVQLAACEQVLQLWAEMNEREEKAEREGKADDDDHDRKSVREHRAIVRLLPQVLRRTALGPANPSADTMRNVTSLLIKEKQLTPSIAWFLKAVIAMDPDQVIAHFDGFLREEHYLTRWQEVWIMHSLVHNADRLSPTLTKWCRSRLDRQANPDELRAQAALLLARKNEIAPVELAQLYDEVGLAIRPVVCAAFGCLDLSNDVTKAVLAESQLNKWACAWGRTL